MNLDLNFTQRTAHVVGGPRNGRIPATTAVVTWAELRAHQAECGIGFLASTGLILATPMGLRLGVASISGYASLITGMVAGRGFAMLLIQVTAGSANHLLWTAQFAEYEVDSPGSWTFGHHFQAKDPFIRLLDFAFKPHTYSHYGGAAQGASQSITA